jgi:hypothetical protein
MKFLDVVAAEIRRDSTSELRQDELQARAEAAVRDYVTNWFEKLPPGPVTVRDVSNLVALAMKIQHDTDKRYGWPAR